MERSIGMGGYFLEISKGLATALSAMDAEYYTSILGEGLLSAAYKIIKEL